MPVQQIAVVSNHNQSMEETGNGADKAVSDNQLGTDVVEELTESYRHTGEQTGGEELSGDLQRGGQGGVDVGHCDGVPDTDKDGWLETGIGGVETGIGGIETETGGIETGDTGGNTDPGDAHITHVDADTVILGESETHTGSETETHVNVTVVHTPINTIGTGQTDTQPTDKPPTTRSNGKKKDKPTPLKKKDSIAKETLHANSPTPMSTERCDSSLSNSSVDVCRICQCESCEIQSDSPLLTPCLCSGSLKYIHQACLQKWIKSSDKMSCELCQFEYHMTKKTKPFREWERLEMTQAERRKVVCSVTFHVIAITCVVWSLYVLIDRTTEEVEAGSLLWPFWTKLIVVAIGFTGGVVFMYVQCKMYWTLCKKWRMYNKVIIISSISEAHREKSNHMSLQRLLEKQRQLEEGHVTTLFNVVSETESV